MNKKFRPLAAGSLIAGLIAFVFNLFPAQAHSIPVLYNALNLEGYFSKIWWQWTNSLPVTTDKGTGFDCAVHQSGRIWFLPSVLPDQMKNDGQNFKVSYDCNIPVGKVVFFPVATSICSVDAQADPSYAELRDCAVGKMNLIVDIVADVDGLLIDSLSRSSTKHQALSPIFYTPMPGDQAINGAEASVQASVSDGWWILLPALSPGKHTIHYRVEGALAPDQPSPSYVYDVTYRVLMANPKIGK
jgi:hypothetical protein